MTKLSELYKCDICGNVVEIVHEGAPALVCCKKPMLKLEIKTGAEGKEKHVPVVKEECCSTLIEVGDIHHPMLKEHYIKFVEVFLTDGKIIRIELSPEQVPSVSLNLDVSTIAEVRAYCNLHGVWSNK